MRRTPTRDAEMGPVLFSVEATGWRSGWGDDPLPEDP